MNKEQLKDFDIDNAMDALKNETVENFLSNKTLLSNFTDIQRGMITEWLKEAIEKGYELGLKSTFVNDADIKDTMKGFLEQFTKNPGTESSDLEEQIRMYKKLFNSEQMVSSCKGSIIMELSEQNRILQYALMTPEERKSHTCYEIVRP